MNAATAIQASAECDAIVLEGVSATGRLDGLLLEFSVVQRYRNPGPANIEAVYSFPVPHDAVLLDLEVRIGGRVLTGVVVEKRRAEARYEDALAAGDSAAMLERAADGVYTVNLGNLGEGERATLRYRYAQLLCVEGAIDAGSGKRGSLRVTVPTVIAPRYGSAAGAGLQPHQAPAHDIAAAHEFDLSLTLEGAAAAGAIASPTHSIATTREGGGVTVRLAQRAWLDRDFVLTVSDVAAESLALLGEDGDGCVALASFCVEPARAAPASPLALKLLVDCSGSMAGDSMHAARRALSRILGALTPADRFSLTRFGSQVADVVPRLTAVAARAIGQARSDVAHIDADLGGTEMAGALREVFARDASAEGADVLLITDGEVWSADALVALARAARQRVFVVGVGSAPAHSVLRRLATGSGGACEFVTPGEDAEAAIVRMFARLRAPRLARVEARWPMPPVWTTALPSAIFGGETVHVFAAFGTTPAGAATLLSATGSGSQPVAGSIALPTAIVSGSTLARLAAMRRLDTADAEEQLELALRYSLITDRTNCIVIHQRAEADKLHDLPALRQIAQMHAAGWGGAGSVMAVPPPPCAAPVERTSAKRVLAMPNILERAAAYAIPGSAARQTRVRGLAAARSTGPDAIDSGGVSEDVAALLSRLEQRLHLLRPNRLPESIDDLERCGVDAETIAALRALIAQGFDERHVALGFLGALAPLAERAGQSRQLCRALRRIRAVATRQTELWPEVEALASS